MTSWVNAPKQLQLNLLLVSTETNIKDFMAMYRKEFPWATVLPKMHVMEDHVIPWCRRFRLGAGLMGEQGAESIHARIMKLERDYRGIRDKLDSLKYIVAEQALYTAPSLQALEPLIKRRKTKSLDNSDSETEDEVEGIGEEENGEEENDDVCNKSILVFRTLS